MKTYSVANRIVFAGARKDRRIEPHTFASWRLKQRDRDLDEEDRDDNPV